MKQEDIIILKLIKELLQDSTHLQAVESMLDDNILEKLNISHMTNPTPSRELQNLQAQNKLLLERLDSQSSMTELGMKHMMQELSELKEKCAEMTMPKTNITNLGNTGIDEERKALIKERKALEEERNRLENLANQLRSNKQVAQGANMQNSTNLDWQILQSNLLADTQKLQKYLPQSYLFTSDSYQDNSFVWLGEKMGLTYTVIIYCQENTEIQNNTLMILLNSWLNQIILESRFMLDIEQITKEIYTRLDNLRLRQNYVKLGITSIDYLNSSISFLGAGVDLWKFRNANIKTFTQEFSNFEDKKFVQNLRKHNLQAEQNSSFFMICTDDKQSAFKQNLTQELMNSTVDISQQKQKLERFLTRFRDFTLLGFKV